MAETAAGGEVTVAFTAEGSTLGTGSTGTTRAKAAEARLIASCAISTQDDTSVEELV